MTQMPPKRTGNTDECYTPPYAIEPLLPYLKKEWTILECAYGQGHLAEIISKHGYKVIGSKEYNFLTDARPECDCIVTNPPYATKTKFLRRCFQSNKPFALLLPLTALEGKERNEMYRQHKIQLIVPNARINFIMPGDPTKKSQAWFQTAWFTSGLNLPEQLNFVELDTKEDNGHGKEKLWF